MYKKYTSDSRLLGLGLINGRPMSIYPFLV